MSIHDSFHESSAYAQRVERKQRPASKGVRYAVAVAPRSRDPLFKVSACPSKCLSFFLSLDLVSRSLTTNSPHGVRPHMINGCICSIKRCSSHSSHWSHKFQHLTEWLWRVRSMLILEINPTTPSARFTAAPRTSRNYVTLVEPQKSSECINVARVETSFAVVLFDRNCRIDCHRHHRP